MDDILMLSAGTNKTQKSKKMVMHSRGISNNTSSTPISALLPHCIKGSIPKQLFTSCIFLLRCLDSPQLPPWIVLTVENSNTGVTRFFNPFTRTLISNLPQNFLLTQFNSTRLTTEYHLVNSNDPFTSDSLYMKVLIALPNQKAVIVDGVSSVSSKCTLLALLIGGQVYKLYPFDESDYHAFEKAFHTPTIVDDVVMYNSKIYALSNVEKLYLYRGGKHHFFNGDCGFYFFVVNVSHSEANMNVERRRRRRLVVLSSSKGIYANKLYMIVPVDEGYVTGSTMAIQLHFKVKELKLKDKSKWVWEEVTRFGDGDQVLFVSRDHCFFVAVSEYPQCNISNCIVYSNDAFPQYSESDCGWKYESEGRNEVAVFPLEGVFDPYFPIILLSTPFWLSQNTSCLQAQSQSQPQSESQSRSEPGCTVKFQGIHIELEHILVLEKVREKYGDVVEGSAIRGCDAITMAWTSLAKMLLILQSNSGNTLTDDQICYLTTTLHDLQLMQVKVDWLVPYVEKTLALQKIKQLQASLMELEKAKDKVLSEMVELRQHGPLDPEVGLDEGLFY